MHTPIYITLVIEYNMPLTNTHTHTGPSETEVGDDEGDGMAVEADQGSQQRGEGDIEEADAASSAVSGVLAGNSEAVGGFEGGQMEGEIEVESEASA
jgi:hypothetical protein